ncbi:helix-hairpin-helix domain-containing protein [Pseudobacteroides cellulosolvens]|uniref:Competence protein ComEA helix-hairpin-helix repeat protein n=1 Tax=Pseudobacteroides cellulosolvens ATCC 35603 = DSM 2933 TaxID=398512 RepID=A0A0L6JNM8_9FIRM|nr:helix-hairpin-helix domain-containing protein [Pseudobacteroides cellulosolvens]KNY26962.1 competence protein ComEA helix-hairpin-helix repeat protein [Pseudobacteroides cellulosolvens ATCC 35603 = DSM 2933]
MEFKFFGREIYVRKSILAASALALLIVLGTIGYLIKIRNQPIIFMSDDQKSPVIANNAVSTPMEKKMSTPSPTEVQEEIKVYITGCVKKPGIITLKKGQLIFDAVNAAGGLTDNADKNINMVYALNENVWLNIKSKNEANTGIENKPSNGPANGKSSQPSINKASGNGETNNEAGKAVKIIKDSGGVLASEKGQGTSTKININTASADEMDAALPGIGPAIAADIVEYRNKHGKFKTIEDLLNVPGIGESKFNRLKGVVAVN